MTETQTVQITNEAVRFAREKWADYADRMNADLPETMHFPPFYALHAQQQAEMIEAAAKHLAGEFTVTKST